MPFGNVHAQIDAVAARTAAKAAPTPADVALVLIWVLPPSEPEQSRPSSAHEPEITGS